MFNWFRRQGSARQAKGERMRLAEHDFNELMNHIDHQIAHDQFAHALDQLRPLEAAYGDNVAFLSRLGFLRYMLGHFEEAEKNLQATLAIEPNHAQALKFLTGTYYAIGQPREGLAIGTRAIATGLADEQVHNAMGAMYLQVGDPNSAASAFQRAIQLNPADTVALANLEAVRGRFSANDLGRAEGEQTRAVREAWIEEYSKKLASGVLSMVEAERFTQIIGVQQPYWSLALQMVDEFSQRPDLSGTLAHNLSSVCTVAGRTQEALALSQLALERLPGKFEGRAGLGSRLVHQGGARWSEGWRIMAETNRQFNPDNFPDTVPPWIGEDIAGQRLFVHFDQGIGDAILALRFIPMLAARGIAVVLWVPPTIEPLVEALAPYAQVVHSEHMPDPLQLGCDYSCGLMDLPAGLHLQPHDLAQFPLLAAPARSAFTWRLPPTQCDVTLALVTLGNPSRHDDWLRSISVESLEPLRRLENIQWVNLAMSPRPEVSEMVNIFHMADPTAQIQSFTDTATVLAAVDGVIAIDCSVAHLAAALGRPLWVLKPCIDDWRWQIGPTLSPWWPAARVFICDGPGQWQEAVKALTKDLVAYDFGKSSRT